MSEATIKPTDRKTAVRGELPKIPADGPLYEVTKRTHFIHGRDWQPGERVYYHGKPGRLLVPLNDAAREAKAKAEGKPVPAKAPSKSEPPPPGNTFLDRNAPEILADLKGQTVEQLAEHAEAEKAGKNRKGVLEAITAELAERSASA